MDTAKREELKHFEPESLERGRGELQLRTAPCGEDCRDVNDIVIIFLAAPTTSFSNSSSFSLLSAAGLYLLAVLITIHPAAALP